MNRKSPIPRRERVRNRQGCCPCVACVERLVALREWQPLIERAERTIDSLYASGNRCCNDAAEHLDALLEEFLEFVHTSLEELYLESHEDLETGIEDYETGDADDEAPGPDEYWEPDMIVASDPGF